MKATLTNQTTFLEACQFHIKHAASHVPHGNDFTKKESRLARFPRFYLPFVGMECDTFFGRIFAESSSIIFITMLAPRNLVTKFEFLWSKRLR